MSDNLDENIGWEDSSGLQINKTSGHTSWHSADKESQKSMQSKPLSPNFDSSNMAKAFESLLTDNQIYKTITPEPDPKVYDDLSEANNIKIAEKFPKFEFGCLIDEVLESFGGVLEIMRCTWDDNFKQGTVVCLMKDWRVFQLNLKANDFALLDREKRISKINRECLIFEDIEDLHHFEDLNGLDSDDDKRKLENKVKEEKITAYGEKMSSALDDLFSGNVDAISKIMSKNTGKVKGSYLDSEA
jgi:hypothetical protein